MRERNKRLSISCIIAFMFIIITFICPVQAFVVNTLDYNVTTNGDATITANYTLSFIESIALAVPSIKDEFSKTLKTEYGPETQINTISDNYTQFTVKNFGFVHDNCVQTPFITFENVKNRLDSYWFLKILNIDYSPTVTTITSFNGTKFTFNDQMTIPPVTLNY